MIPQFVDTAGVPFNFFIGSGANSAIQFTIEDTAGNVVDVSGLSLKLTIVSKLESGSTVIAAEKASTFVSDGTDGKISFDMTTFDFDTTYKDAILTIYDLVNADKRPKLQYRTNIVDQGVG